jgi:hypothetical protein
MAAEYVEASQVTDELMHATKLLGDFGIQSKPNILMQDSQATARSLENLIEDGKTEYLAVHFHYVREWVACGDLVKWVDSRSTLADMFTKPLGLARLREMSGKLGLGGGWGEFI